MCLIQNENSNLENRVFEIQYFGCYWGYSFRQFMWSRFNLFRYSNTICNTRRIHSQHKDRTFDDLSFLHINIRNVNKKFENFKLFLSSLSFTFILISFPIHGLMKTSSNKSFYELSNYTSIHHVKKQRRGKECRCISTNL